MQSNIKNVKINVLEITFTNIEYIERPKFREISERLSTESATAALYIYIQYILGEH